MKNTKEIEREGGMVWAVDITGHKLALTKEEARHLPMVARMIPWKRVVDLWIAPSDADIAATD